MPDVLERRAERAGRARRPRGTTSRSSFGASGSLSLTSRVWPAGAVDDQDAAYRGRGLLRPQPAARRWLWKGHDRSARAPSPSWQAGASTDSWRSARTFEVLVFWSSRAPQPSAASGRRHRSSASELVLVGPRLLRRRAAADSREARVTATFGLAGGGARPIGGPGAAAFDALAAATFLRCAVLRARRLLLGSGCGTESPSSRCAALALAISRLLRRAALLRWMMPFSAALSRALMAAVTACGAVALLRPSAMRVARLDERLRLAAGAPVHRAAAQRLAHALQRLTGCARPSRCEPFLPRGDLGGVESTGTNARPLERIRDESIAGRSDGPDRPGRWLDRPPSGIGQSRLGGGCAIRRRETPSTRREPAGPPASMKILPPAVATARRDSRLRAGAR